MKSANRMIKKWEVKYSALDSLRKKNPRNKTVQKLIFYLDRSMNRNKGRFHTIVITRFLV